MTTDYSDILHLPHHVSATRPRMSMLDRAAQFAPFAALTGHGEAQKSTALHAADEHQSNDNIMDNSVEL